MGSWVALGWLLGGLGTLQQWTAALLGEDGGWLLERGAWGAWGNWEGAEALKQSHFAG